MDVNFKRAVIREKGKSLGEQMVHEYRKKKVWGESEVIKMKRRNEIFEKRKKAQGEGFV